ncbi:MAG: metallophosphoesterase [Flavipsychrobacter sp.]|nr:metallophosphoesterase [Flavipsychrobacter sp.]
MRSSGMIWVILVFLLILDLYVFQALRHVTQAWSVRSRQTMLIGFWVISIGVAVVFVFMPQLGANNWPKTVRSYVFATIVGLFFSKLIASVFFLVDDVRRGVQFTAGKVIPKAKAASEENDHGISRSAFLSWLGLAAGSALFGTFMYGFTNKYNYSVKRHRLSYGNLPAAFKGLRILQISDIHSGSFTDPIAVQKGVDRIQQLNPDIILFTGDLVNDRAVEMEPYKEIFSQLKAPLGVYSVLGNHDYGDYFQWESRAAKEKNLADLIQLHADMGWRLLMNEHVVLEREGEKIALIGIENWGAKANFPKYGNLSNAYKGAAEYPFKILMSHDPSHWDAEVRQTYPDIDLTLSGHTHGMQFGVELPGFKWSPVQYIYKQWAGLYETERQKLYVNRGFGFIGYPGRVGILPEITILELV